MRIRLAELLRRAADRLDRKPFYEITLCGDQIIVSSTDVPTAEVVEEMRAICDAFAQGWQQTSRTFSGSNSIQNPRIIGRSEDG